jgi:hypothetical protein
MVGWYGHSCTLVFSVSLSCDWHHGITMAFGLCIEHLVVSPVEQHICGLHSYKIRGHSILVRVVGTPLASIWKSEVLVLFRTYNTVLEKALNHTKHTHQSNL